jgi:hypothetical protein
LRSRVGYGLACKLLRRRLNIADPRQPIRVDPVALIRPIVAKREHTKSMAKAPAKSLAKAPPKATVAMTKGALTQVAVTKPATKTPTKTAPASRVPLHAADTMALAMKRLATQNTQLAKSLADAEARIAELERQRDSALDRIEWVIDSLHSLRDEQG